MDLAKFSDEVYAWVERMGWHNKIPLEYLALIGSEVGEAVNECRGKQPTGNLGIELADILIRLVDFAKVCGVDLVMEAEVKMKINHERGTRGRLK